MKQPRNEIDVIKYEFSNDFGVRLEGDSFGWMDVGYGLSEKSAYKAAARRLRKLANECERKSK